MIVHCVELTKDAFFCLYNAERAEYDLPEIPEDDRERVWSHMRKNLAIGKESVIVDCSDHDLNLLAASGLPYHLVGRAVI